MHYNPENQTDVFTVVRNSNLILISTDLESPCVCEHSFSLFLIFGVSEFTVSILFQERENNSRPIR
jgi:hypothetical protein